MLSTSVAYRLVARDLQQSLDLKRAEAPVAREVDYYLTRIGEVRSIDDLFADTRLYNVAMTAFGLEDMAYAKAYMRKILEEGVDDPNAFVNRLNESRFVDFARTFNFARDGEAAVQGADAQGGVADRYVRQRLEVAAGADNEGVRLALYFLREAPKVTSAYDLLADPALWEVISTVFAFPDAMANADIDKQAAAVTARLDLADLADPEKLDRLIGRFTATWEATQATLQDPVLTLFGAGDAEASVDLNLVMTLNNLRRGGV